MSRRHGTRGRTTPRRPRLSRSVAANVVAISRIIRGCDCDRGFTLTHGRGNELDVASVDHRDGCAALTSPALELYAPIPERP